MNYKLRINTCLILLCLCFVLVLTASCDSGETAENGLKISGPGDLYYLSVRINQQATDSPEIPAINMRVSGDSIRDLKQGKSDAVFLGREPTAQELAGLTDYVLAHDAVCIVLDENTFLGGTVYSAGRPLRKSGGLQELSSQAVRDIFSRQGFAWGEDFYDGNRDVDLGSFLMNIESVVWVKSARVLANSFYFPPGKYDTQTVIYQTLGLDEKVILNGWKAFTSSRFDIEEEVISYEYSLSHYSQASGKQDFPFKLSFGSRRAMTVAPLHVPVKVLPIDGIDPMANKEAIYDGSYLFSRKIHLLTREDSPLIVRQLANYLVSAEGQKFLEETGYLPIIQQ